MAADSTIGKMDMLNGPLLSRIIMFSLPLVASGILQQSFNAIDVVVVGRYCSHQAMAAVGGNGVIINIIINLFIGISIGANVVVANYIGRRNHNGIRQAVATVGAFALISGVLLTVIGIAAARPILEWMNTPDDVIDLASRYLSIFFLGMPFLMVYNFGAAVLRSMGDTRRPFYSLVAAGVLNTVLNLFFVIVCGMNVEGVAIATVAGFALNAALVTYWLMREPDPLRLRPRTMRIHLGEMRKMLQIGIPAGLQGMVFSIANIFIVAAINRYGSLAIAGSAAALNFELYCYFIMVAFCQAAVAFISQNYGAGQYGRCRRAYLYCMLMSVVCVGAANVAITLTGKWCIGLFSADPQVIHYGMERLQYVLMFQFIASSYEISGSALRGLGYSMTPTLLVVFGTCVIRLGWVYYLSTRPSTYTELLSIYPVTWVITGILVVTAYLIVSHKVYGSKPQTA